MHQPSALPALLNSFSRRWIFVACLICSVFLTTQLRADNVRPVPDDDDRGVQHLDLHDLNVQRLAVHIEKDSKENRPAAINVSHFADKNGYSKTLKLILNSPHTGGQNNAVGFGIAGTPSPGTLSLRTKNDDGISTVPEPSSLLLLGSGLLALGTVLRKRRLGGSK